VDNNDSSNGGLQFVECTETLSLNKEDLIKHLNVPNTDLVFDDIELIPTKPRMPVSKR
jgi:hypothetical protein